MNSMTLSTKLDEAERSEEWQKFHREEMRLDNRGFRGDADVVMLGLEEMEDELTMADLPTHIQPRHAFKAIPVGSATPTEARIARDGDIDDMTHPEWDADAQ